MAEAQRQPGPDNRRDLVSRLKLEYAEALKEAQVSAQHTDTEGWQHLYQGFHKDNREKRRLVSAQLKMLAGNLELADIGEDGEKEIGDIKKTVVAIREEREIFAHTAVEPVREAVEKCQRVIADAKRQARSDEERAPLVNIGLTEMVEMEIRKLDRAAWDSDTGRVEIKPPSND